MQLRSEIQIASMIKAMKDVVLPAIDPVNRLAVEQSQLIIGMLGLMQHQLPLQFRFDRDELRRLSNTLGELEALAATDAALADQAAPLRELRAGSEQLLKACAVDPAELQARVRLLREEIGDFTAEALRQGAAATVPRIERVVLDLSREQLLRDRALTAPQGWDPDPAALPSIQALLASAEAHDEEKP